MLREDLTARSLELRAARVPFVHARVTLAEAPTSARPGDEAIVLADGSLEGFVGGTCAESTVREAALGLLEPLVLRITPVAEEERPDGSPAPGRHGKRVVHNPCLSGGTLEVFLEPIVPPPLVAIVGRSPTAQALAAVGAALGWAVQEWDGTVPDGAAAVVVASHGRGEEDPLTAALEAAVPYVALVASRARGRAVVAALPVSEELRARVRTPAGLDLGARTAGEVALSILAEAVRDRAVTPPPPPQQAALPGGVTRAVDPVCGMTVLADAATPVLQHDGRTLWFCGRGCRDAFAADPVAYL